MPEEGAIDFAATGADGHAHNGHGASPSPGSGGSPAPAPSRPPGRWSAPPRPGGVIDPDVLWSCTTCGACVEQCPVDIEHVDHIVDMRRYQVMIESEFPSELGRAVPQPGEQGQPLGAERPQPPGLDQGPADFEVPVYRRGAVRGDGVPVLDRLRGGVRRQGAEDRAGHRRAAAPRRRRLRRARPGGDLHRGPGPPVGQRVPVPDAGRAERRGAQHRVRGPRAGHPQDRHDLPALLQHAGPRVPAAGRALRGGAPHPAAQQAGPRGQAGAGRRARTASWT